MHNFLVVYYSHHANYSVELPDGTRGQIQDVCDALVAHVYAPMLQPGTDLSPLERRRLESEARDLMQTFYYFKGTTQPNDMLGYTSSSFSQFVVDLTCMTNRAVGKMMPGWTCQALDSGCWRKGPLSGHAAKTCGRCKAATYCGEGLFVNILQVGVLTLFLSVHQKQDWKAGHKHCCFVTTW